MTSLRGQIITLLEKQPGLTDREIFEQLRAFVPSELPVAHASRQLEQEGLIKRIKRLGRPSGNYLAYDKTEPVEIDLGDPQFIDDVETPEGSAASILHNLGFALVGEWASLNGQVTYVLTRDADRSGLLFAFIQDGTVLYLERSPRTLAHRMNAILTSRGEESAKKLNGYVRNLVTRGKQIQIWALRDPGTLSYGGYRLSLAAGLEPTLQEEIRPMWNVHLEAA